MYLFLNEFNTVCIDYIWFPQIEIRSRVKFQGPKCVFRPLFGVHICVACQTLRSSCVKLSIFLYWTISYWNASFVVPWLFDSIWFSLDLHALDVCTLYLQFPSNCFWGTVLDQSHILIIGSHFHLCQETKNGARECVRLCRPSPEFRKLPIRIGKISSVKGDSRDSQ